MTVTQAVVDSDDDGDGDNNSEVNHKCAGLLFSLYCLFFFFFLVLLRGEEDKVEG